MSDPAFSDVYRSAAQDFPRPVAVVGCLRGKQRHAITVDSFVDVSYDPPTMALSIYSGSRMAESLELTDTCSLSVLTADQKGIAQWLGEPAQPLHGVLDSIDTADAPSGSPLVAGCAAWFDLRIVERVTIATHDLLVCRVEACSADGTSPPPLVHWAAGYHRPAAR
ncbi:MAG TPA: flavin reductase family protein [Brevibacterium sp.]|nr:flavin reductase family protein [Brevibacterium sp.]